jgi:hypothetical protein
MLIHRSGDTSHERDEETGDDGYQQKAGTALKKTDCNDHVALPVDLMR